MSNTDARRDIILDRLADFVLAEGLAAASLRPLARAAGTSDRMLLYYFKDKDDLMAATLARAIGRLNAALAALAAEPPQPLDLARSRVWAIIGGEDFAPFMRLWLEIVSRAARGETFYRTIGEHIARGFLAWGASRLTGGEADAARLLVSIEGLLVLRSVGLDDVCRWAI